MKLRCLRCSEILKAKDEELLFRPDKGVVCAVVGDYTGTILATIPGFESLRFYICLKCLEDTLARSDYYVMRGSGEAHQWRRRRFEDWVEKIMAAPDKPKNDT